MLKYFYLWRQLSSLAAGSYLSSRVDSISFLAGKIFRFGFFLLFILAIFGHTDTMAGYGKYEVLLFFLTFNLIDVMAQAFFRGIYLFQDDIRRGNFDYILTKPVNSLFYSLARLTDILDMFFLLPLIALTIYTVGKLDIALTIFNVLGYLGLMALGLVIVLSIHILTASITVRTYESENFIWLYRDSMIIGRFPPEIFSYPVQILFTYFVPVIVIVAFPVKALLGSFSITMLFTSITIASVFLVGSIYIWQKCLKHYQSASS